MMMQICRMEAMEVTDQVRLSPKVVQPDQVEEVGTLVPQAALEAIPVHSLHYQDSPFHCLTAPTFSCMPPSTIGMLR